MADVRTALMRRRPHEYERGDQDRCFICGLSEGAAVHEVQPVGDNLPPVGAEDPERAVALHKHEEGLTKSQDKRVKDDAVRFTSEPYEGGFTIKDTVTKFLEYELSHKTYATKMEADKVAEGLNRRMLGSKGRDELPVPVKPVDLVPGPSGENNEETYAPRPVGDAREYELLGCGPAKKFGDSAEAVRYAAVQGCKDYVVLGEGDRLVYEMVKGKGTNHSVSAEQGGKRRQVGDAKATLPIEHAGSEPKDHMIRANRYEIAGDRARALDSYRAAASGFRKVNDQANEAKARDGITACQTKFDQHYHHPGHGRTKVCDSADAAIRTAVERTRAGETVQVLGSTVQPRARTKDVETTYHYAEKPKQPKPLLSVADPEERKKMAAEPYRTRDVDPAEPVEPDMPSPVPVGDTKIKDFTESELSKVSVEQLTRQKEQVSIRLRHVIKKSGAEAPYASELRKELAEIESALTSARTKAKDKELQPV